MSSGDTCSLARRFAMLMVCGVLVWGLSSDAHAASLGLRFAGTIDLSAFGAPSTSTFDGRVSWDPSLSCGPGGGGEGDFPLSQANGDPPCVTAALRVNAMSRHGFDPELSRLMLFPYGLVLQLWFVPPVDLDGGIAPDVLLMELELWRRADHGPAVFPDIGELPEDLTFLGRLPDRAFTVSSLGCFDWYEGACAHARADTLTVVPEPSSMTLVLTALATVAIGRRRRRTMPPAV